MKPRRILFGLLLWTVLVTALHLKLNVDWSAFFNSELSADVLDRKIEFEEYVYVRFAEGSRMETPWRYEPGSAPAE